MMQKQDGTVLQHPQSHQDNLAAGRVITQDHPKSDPVPVHPGCHGRDDGSRDC